MPEQVASTSKLAWSPHRLITFCSHANQAKFNIFREWHDCADMPTPPFKVSGSILRGLSKTQFEEIETDGRAEGIKKCVKWPPVIGERDLPGLEVRNRALDRSTDGTDLAIVFVFTRVEFTFPWLLGRRNLASALDSLVGDNRSGNVEHLLHFSVQLLHVMVPSNRRS